MTILGGAATTVFMMVFGACCFLAGVFLGVYAVDGPSGRHWAFMLVAVGACAGGMYLIVLAISMAGGRMF